MNIAARIFAKLNREATYLRRNAVYALGASKNFYRNARGCRIMIYHGITRQNYSRFNPIFLQLKMFESHLKFYKKYFNIVSLDDVYQQRLSNSRFNICLTFDDGFANNYQYVLPMLEASQIPATFFITAIRDAGHDVLWNDFLTVVSKYGPAELIYKKQRYYKNKYDRYISCVNGMSLAMQMCATGFAAKQELMDSLYPLAPFREFGVEPDLWLQMTPEQIRELSASPMGSIGAHSYYHNDLAQIDIHDATGEIVRSKNYLENLIQKPVNSFAFPYGAYTPQVVDAAKNAGYNQLLAMDFLYPNDHEDDTMKERFTINPYLSVINQMYATVTRAYEQ